MTYEPEPIETIQNLKPGQPHYGVKRQNLFPDPEPRGYLKAIDPLTGKSKWETGFKSPNWAGTLVTAGGLLFTGTLIGEFIAVDVDTGRIVWQFQTPSGIIGQPVTWERNGKQYVTVTSGIVRPGFGARLTRAGDGVVTPELFSGGGVMTFEVAAATELGSGHTIDQHTVCAQRRACHREAVLSLRRLDVPHLLSSLHVERNHVCVERGTEEHALIDRGTAVHDPTANNPCRLRRIFDERLPDLFARDSVDRHGLVVACDVHHTVLNKHLRLFTVIAGHAV